MVKILRDLLFRPDLRKVQNESLANQIKYFWRKGWEEMPELMVLISPTIVTLFVTVHVIRKQLEEKDKLPRYYNEYTVFRPNNPKVPRIRTDDYLSIEEPQHTMS
ncbi:uncharacterized protein LOC114877925 [Osmia bicornis bicornis]|uniref:uncharacterized protein LOC114877925 n=1 Tax=Osmia bicornis bicornis TaxID=1437191 RepID=UPI0010F4FB08|nr:uncharacterized protein LOC114877925 [Osmia bicornis bicornis]